MVTVISVCDLFILTLMQDEEGDDIRAAQRQRTDGGPTAAPPLVSPLPSPVNRRSSAHTPQATPASEGELGKG